MVDGELPLGDRRVHTKRKRGRGGEKAPRNRRRALELEAPRDLLGLGRGERETPSTRDSRVEGARGPAHRREHCLEGGVLEVDTERGGVLRDGQGLVELKLRASRCEATSRESDGQNRAVPEHFPAPIPDGNSGDLTLGEQEGSLEGLRFRRDRQHSAERCGSLDEARSAVEAEDRLGETSGLTLRLDVEPGVDPSREADLSRGGQSAEIRGHYPLAQEELIRDELKVGGHPRRKLAMTLDLQHARVIGKSTSESTIPKPFQIHRHVTRLESPRNALVLDAEDGPRNGDAVRGERNPGEPGCLRAATRKHEPLLTVFQKRNRQPLEAQLGPAQLEGEERCEPQFSPNGFDFQDGLVTAGRTERDVAELEGISR